MLAENADESEVCQQLQRIEVLHQQLKAEALRAQDFLTKLRLGQIEAPSISHNQPARPTRPPAPPHGLHEIASGTTESRHRCAAQNGSAKCGCTCTHAMQPPVQSRGSNSKKNGSLLASPARVDEREVRDLEKRVRGLEQRVRGFEGLPPDRELALMEVEKLRKELEGLARRREGLFEGLELSNGLSFGLNAAAAKLEEVLGPDLSAKDALQRLEETVQPRKIRSKHIK